MKMILNIITKIWKLILNNNYFIPIMFLDNSLILSDKVCNLPSILTSKYILRAIGNPTEAIRVCNSEFINTHPFNKVKAMQRWGDLGIAF